MEDDCRMLGELTIDETLFDQIMAERRQKPLTMKLWPWVAAACVAAVVAVLLLPSRESHDGASTGSGELATQTCSIVNEQGVEGARERKFPTTNQNCQMTPPDTHHSRIAKTIGRDPELEAPASACPTATLLSGNARKAAFWRSLPKDG